MHESEAEQLNIKPSDGPVRVRKYLGLQILRIVAACMVVVTHSTFYASERLDKRFPIWGSGASGVNLFFVLSGFVMVCSSGKLVARPNGWKIFAERRIVRIVPMYWIATTIKLVVLICTTGYVLHSRLGIFNTFASYLFIPSKDPGGNIGPLLNVGWTLNYEMFFYLLFALALLFRLNIYRFIGCVLVLLTIGSFFRQPTWPAIAVYLSTRVIEFFYGMMIARLCLSGRHLPRFAAVIFVFLGFYSLMGPLPYIERTYGLGAGVAAALVVYGTASLEDSLTRIPRFVLYGADASYAIYLFHPLIAPAIPVVLMRLHLDFPILSVLCSVFIAILTGCVVHSLIEAPITEWFKNHLRVEGKEVIHPVNATG